jgi:hypothetical protein
VKRRPYVLSLSGPGTKLRLELDRHSFAHAMAWVGGLFGGGEHEHGDGDDFEDLDTEEQHMRTHEQAPVAIRAMLKGLCPELLEDAEQAIAEEKRRRIDAS